MRHASSEPAARPLDERSAVETQARARCPRGRAEREPCAHGDILVGSFRVAREDRREKSSLAAIRACKTVYEILR
jgi:hypothetical protein